MSRTDVPARLNTSFSEETIAFADAALGAAGHSVTEPELRDLMSAVARHEISADEAIAAARRHIQS